MGPAGPRPNLTVAKQRQATELLVPPGIHNIGREVLQADLQGVRKCCHGAVQYLPSCAPRQQKKSDIQHLFGISATS
jgi:hypothetical protein